jgi:hypothetical protein
MSGGTGTLDWDVLVPRLVHETKVWILEAMRWLDRPLSARELQRLCAGAKSISGLEYHLLSLVEAQAIEVVERRIRSCRARDKDRDL